MIPRNAEVGTPLSVVVAPDSFKGSARASEVARAISEGFAAGCAGSSFDITLTSIPFADGGEGTLDALIDAWGTKAETVQTSDALGRPVLSRLGVSPDGVTAVIEVAEACGLPQVSDVPFRPLDATTHGLGAVVLRALDLRVQRIILCLGGSATTDGGTGLLSALGAIFLDAAGNELMPGGGALRELAAVDTGGLDDRAGTVQWLLACDVTNPLLGASGAAMVFAPQKGANGEEMVRLDAALTQLADVVEPLTGRELRTLPGMGAAGGLAFSLASCFDVELVPGWDLVAQTLDAHETLANADLVLTGEGRLDSQSLHGKVVSGVLQAAGERTDVIVIAGSVDLDEAQIVDAGILAAYSIACGPASLAELSANVVALIRVAAFNVARTYCGVSNTAGRDRNKDFRL